MLLVGHEQNLRSVATHPAAVTFAPLTTLLPRCSVAVVSGALGGLAAALTAGVPVVVHPQLVDQSWHARRVTELGVGLAARRVTDVAPAAARVANDPSFSERARAWRRGWPARTDRAPSSRPLNAAHNALMVEFVSRAAVGS